MKRRKILTILIIYLFACMTGFLWMSENSGAKTAAPKKITVSEKKKTLAEGEKYQIAYKVKGKKKANKKVLFSSSKKSVATVSKKGVVKAKKAGNVTITLRAKAKKSVKAKVKITVAEKAPALGGSALSLISPVKNLRAASGSSSTTPTALIMQQTLDLEAGQQYQLNVSMMPATATGTITWSCNFTGGINVYPNGSIYVTDDTPVGTTATITARCGSVSATCKVTVINGSCVHQWDTGTVTKVVSCLTDGVRTYTCSKCNKQRTETISATGHVWKAGNLLEEPTCTATGKREYICNKCAETKEEIVPVAGHVWVDGTIIKEPTCTGSGKKQFTCGNCDAEKTETMPANGHSWDSGDITKGPTCTGSGTMTYHCTVEGCKGTRTEQVPANGHTYNYGTVTEPTCTEEGVRISECLVCSKTQKIRIAKTGHDMDDGTEVLAPTCITGGKIEYKCKNCDYTETKSTPSNGHKWKTVKVPDKDGNLVDDEYIVDAEPTCTKAGQKSKHCENCDKQAFVTVIPATGHSVDMKNGERTKEPTCTKTGVIVYKCQAAGCDFARKGTLAALGHAWETEPVTDAAGKPVLDSDGNPVMKEKYTIDVQPTCTKAGEKSIHCTRVNDGELCTIRKNIGSEKATGHSFDAGTVKKAPTCILDGVLHRECQNCTYWKDETITTEGHKYSDYIQDEAPTCTEPGVETKHCEVCGLKSEAKIIPANGHTWGGWSTVKTANCMESGMRERSCATCAKKEQEGIVATGHARNSSGTCIMCGDRVTYEETVSADWNFTLDNTSKIITLRYYKGDKEYITIPKTMNIVEKGVTTTYIVAFKDCEGREETGLFTSNVRGCDVKGVRFAAGMDIEKMSYLFYNCKKLEEVADIPATVKDMYATFKGCANLVSITGGLPSGITELRNTFENCTSLQAAPGIPDTVTSLYATFKNATALKAASSIPAGVTEMSWTFSGCSSLLMPPTLPAALVGMTNTFSDCTSLQEVPASIPAGVSRMTMTYYGCTALRVAPALPATVKTLEYTYMNCSNLTYAVPIARGVEQIGVFVGCNLPEVTT